MVVMDTKLLVVVRTMMLKIDHREKVAIKNCFHSESSQFIDC